MRKSAEIFTEVCDLLCAYPMYSETARRCRPPLSVSIIFKWLAASKRDQANKVDDSKYVFEYGDILGFFHEHVRAAMKNSVIEMEATARHHSIHGTQTQVYFQGRPQFQIDEKLETLDDETLKICGYPDRYRRDGNGQKVPCMIWSPPSPQLVAFMLKGHAPKTFGDKRSISVDGRVTLGVQQVRDRRLDPPMPAPPATPALEHRPQIADVVAEQIMDDESEIAQFAPVDDVADETADTAAQEPSGTDFVDGDGDVTPAMPPRASAIDLSKLSPEALAARQRLQALAAIPPKHPNPTAKVQVFSPVDEPSAASAPKPAPGVRPLPPRAGGAYQSDDSKREGVGTGAPLPNGMKVR